MTSLNTNNSLNYGISINHSVSDNSELRFKNISTLFKYALEGDKEALIQTIATTEPAVSRNDRYRALLVLEQAAQTHREAVLDAALEYVSRSKNLENCHPLPLTLAGMKLSESGSDRNFLNAIKKQLIKSNYSLTGVLDTFFEKGRVFNGDFAAAALRGDLNNAGPIKVMGFINGGRANEKKNFLEGLKKPMGDDDYHLYGYHLPPSSNGVHCNHFVTIMVKNVKDENGENRKKISILDSLPTGKNKDREQVLALKKEIKQLVDDQGVKVFADVPLVKSNLQGASYEDVDPWSVPDVAVPPDAPNMSTPVNSCWAQIENIKNFVSEKKFPPETSPESDLKAYTKIYGAFDNQEKGKLIDNIRTKYIADYFRINEIDYLKSTLAEYKDYDSKLKNERIDYHGYTSHFPLEKAKNPSVKKQRGKITEQHVSTRTHYNKKPVRDTSLQPQTSPNQEPREIIEESALFKTMNEAPYDWEADNKRMMTASGLKPQALSGEDQRKSRENQRKIIEESALFVKKKPSVFRRLFNGFISLFRKKVIPEQKESLTLEKYKLRNDLGTDWSAVNRGDKVKEMYDFDPDITELNPDLFPAKHRKRPAR